MQFILSFCMKSEGGCSWWWLLQNRRRVELGRMLQNFRGSRRGRRNIGKGREVGSWCRICIRGILALPLYVHFYHRSSLEFMTVLLSILFSKITGRYSYSFLQCRGERGEPICCRSVRTSIFGTKIFFWWCLGGLFLWLGRSFIRLTDLWYRRGWLYRYFFMKLCCRRLWLSI